jgi:hypothetical protein
MIAHSAPKTPRRRAAAKLRHHRYTAVNPRFAALNSPQLNCLASVTLRARESALISHGLPQPLTPMESLCFTRYARNHFRITLFRDTPGGGLRTFPKSLVRHFAY